MSVQTGFWDTLSQDQKEEIEIGILEIERGGIVDYEDFIKKYKDENRIRH